MSVHNVDIAVIFEEIADLLEIESANPFRVRAYRNAARTVQSLGEDVSVLVGRSEDMNKLPGKGKALAKRWRK
jgi:DNA polymerase (family 10)